VTSFDAKSTRPPPRIRRSPAEAPPDEPALLALGHQIDATHVKTTLKGFDELKKPDRVCERLGARAEVATALDVMFGLA
jgi:hypothetical protein